MRSRREGDHRGKLRAVARNWAGGRGGTSIPAGDPLTAAAEEHITALTRTSGAEPEIGREQEHVVTLFLSLATQWRHEALSGRRLGLDYAAITPTAAMLDISMSPALLHDLRVMEAAALTEFGRRR